MIHGDVRINDVVVGDWKAENLGQRSGFANYDCYVKWRDTDGALYEADFTIFGVSTSNNAISLAAHILTLAGVHKRKYVRSE